MLAAPLSAHVPQRCHQRISASAAASGEQRAVGRGKGERQGERQVREGRQARSTANGGQGYAHTGILSTAPTRRLEPMRAHSASMGVRLFMRVIGRCVINASVGRPVARRADAHRSAAEPTRTQPEPRATPTEPEGACDPEQPLRVGALVVVLWLRADKGAASIWHRYRSHHTSVSVASYISIGRIIHQYRCILTTLSEQNGIKLCIICIFLSKYYARIIYNVYICIARAHY